MACVKYWYWSRIAAGISTYSIFGRAPEGLEHGGDQITEAARPPGSYVEDAGHRWRLEQPAHDGDGIIDMNEITLLLAVADAVPVRLEQAYRLPRLGGVEALGDETHHFALVILVGTEHVEKLQPRPLRRQLCASGAAVGNETIEQMLAEAVEIHRTQPGQRRRCPVVVEAVCSRRHKSLPRRHR